MYKTTVKWLHTVSSKVENTFSDPKLRTLIFENQKLERKSA